MKISHGGGGKSQQLVNLTNLKQFAQYRLWFLLKAES